MATSLLQVRVEDSLKDEAAQVFAVDERALADLGHAGGDRDAGQVLAALERLFADDRHAGRDRHFGQVGTPPERPFADDQHPVGDRILSDPETGLVSDQRPHVRAEFDAPLLIRLDALFIQRRILAENAQRRTAARQLHHAA